VREDIGADGFERAGEQVVPWRNSRGALTWVDRRRVGEGLGAAPVLAVERVFEGLMSEDGGEDGRVGEGGSVQAGG